MALGEIPEMPLSHFSLHFQNFAYNKLAVVRQQMFFLLCCCSLLLFVCLLFHSFEFVSANGVTDQLV